MFRSMIEFRPYRHHKMTVHLMDLINHCFGIRKTHGVEFMAAPVVFTPVKPIKYDIINRNMPFSEFLENICNFLLCFIALAALPVSHCPLWHHLSFAGELAVS